MKRTINDDGTGGGKDAILAGRYHVLRLLWQGGEKRNQECKWHKVADYRKNQVLEAT